jgi:hypothetical protein
MRETGQGRRDPPHGHIAHRPFDEDTSMRDIRKRTTKQTDPARYVWIDGQLTRVETPAQADSLPDPARDFGEPQTVLMPSKEERSELETALAPFLGMSIPEADALIILQGLIWNDLDWAKVAHELMQRAVALAARKGGR